MQDNLLHFEGSLDGFSWENHGDFYEKKYFRLITPSLLQQELFWKIFVVPATNRITANPDIYIRKDIPEDLAILINHNYMIFLHLVYCSFILERFGNLNLNNKSIDREFQIEDFYIHFVSAFDNFDSLVVKMSLIFGKYISFSPSFIKKQNIEDFLSNMKDWYHSSYEKEYTEKKSKGYWTINTKEKDVESLMIQFFGKKCRSRKAYMRINESVRTMRNLCHSIYIGRLIKGNDIYLPKAEYIGKYRDDFRRVFTAMEDNAVFDNDFTQAYNRMSEELVNAMSALNSLYEEVLMKFMDNGLKAQIYKDIYKLTLAK